MRITENINHSSKSSISNSADLLPSFWKDFDLFINHYNKIKYFWSNKNIYKTHIPKGKKLEKYNEILNEIILVKEKKNVFIKELNLLCFEGRFGEKVDAFLGLWKIIPLSLSSILFYLVNNSSKFEAEFLFYLNEFKHFLKFIIIASTNLSRVNQSKLYHELQNKCLNILIYGFNAFYR